MPQSTPTRVRQTWPLVMVPKPTNRLGPCLLGQAGLFFAGDRGRARTCTPQLRRLMLYPVELRGQPRERRSYCSGSEVASGLSQALYQVPLSRTDEPCGPFGPAPGDGFWSSGRGISPVQVELASI